MPSLSIENGVSLSLHCHWFAFMLVHVLVALPYLNVAFATRIISAFSKRNTIGHPLPLIVSKPDQKLLEVARAVLRTATASALKAGAKS